ncbi:MAG: hypothetical protein ACHP79_15540, partial [Terriglobales bacterium]
DRGICYLKTDQLDAAKRDYDAAYKINLQSDNRRAFQVYYGLGDIAYRQRDTNAAIRHYNSYLASSPRNPDEIKEVQKRLKELSPGAR